MQTVLYLSAAQYLCRSISALREAGFRVVTMDRDPRAPGHLLADAYVTAPIDDADAVADAAARVNAAVILAGIEAGVLSAAIASTALGLPGIGVDVAHRCLDKGLMREVWHARGLAQPEFCLAQTSESVHRCIAQLGLPLVLKPRRSNGSKGVSVILDRDDVPAAVADAENHAEGSGFIVERFIDGPLLTADGFVGGDRVEIAAMGDVETQAVSRFRVNMALNYPSNYPQDVVEKATMLIGRAVLALGLRNSAFHCECIVGSDGPVLVELGARSGGSYIGSIIVPAVSGLIAPVVCARLLLGEQVDITPKTLGGASLTFLSAPAGRLRDVRGLEEARSLPGVVEIGASLALGEQGGAVASDNARHGFVVTVGASRDEAVRRAQDARGAVLFDMV
jgi:biotin carboxylase